jgi:hypothetical protein
MKDFNAVLVEKYFRYSTRKGKIFDEIMDWIAAL